MGAGAGATLTLGAGGGGGVSGVGIGAVSTLVGVRVGAGAGATLTLGAGGGTGIVASVLLKAGDGKSGAGGTGAASGGVGVGGTGTVAGDETVSSLLLRTLLNASSALFNLSTKPLLAGPDAAAALARKSLTLFLNCSNLEGDISSSSGVGVANLTLGAGGGVTGSVVSSTEGGDVRLFWYIITALLTTSSGVILFIHFLDSSLSSELKSFVKLSFLGRSPTCLLELVTHALGGKTGT